MNYPVGVVQTSVALPNSPQSAPVSGDKSPVDSYTMLLKNLNADVPRLTTAIERTMKTLDREYRKLEFLNNKAVDHFTKEDVHLVTVSTILDYLSSDLPVVYEDNNFTIKHRNEFSERMSLEDTFDECEEILTALETAHK